MKLTCLDLELNQPSGKIVQIGAVIGDTQTGEIVDRIRIYVNPANQLQSLSLIYVALLKNRLISKEFHSTKHTFY